MTDGAHVCSSRCIMNQVPLGERSALVFVLLSFPTLFLISSSPRAAGTPCASWAAIPGGTSPLESLSLTERCSFPRIPPYPAFHAGNQSSAGCEHICSFIFRRAFCWYESRVCVDIFFSLGPHKQQHVVPGGWV